MLGLQSVADKGLWMLFRQFGACFSQHILLLLLLSHVSDSFSSSTNENNSSNNNLLDFFTSPALNM